MTLIGKLHPAFFHPASGSTRIILVRHGQTDGNAQGLLHGHTDLPLNEAGKQQALLLANRIQADFAFEAVLSSTLKRAIMTAETLGSAVGLQPELLPGLKEMDFGDFEGMSIEKMFADYPDLAEKWTDRANDSLAWPNGESRRSFRVRVLEAFVTIAESFDGKSVVVVSHNGVMGSFLAHALDTSPGAWDTYRLRNCSITQLEIDRRGTTVISYNDCEHLGEIGLPKPTGAGKIR
ncbi:histidine phosphatase family protein [soil metagenome]